MDETKLLIDCQNAHGEGVIWCPKSQRVMWTDINGKKLWTYSPLTQQSDYFEMPDRLCAFMVREDGSLLAAFDAYVAILHLDELRIEKFYDFEPENPFSRLNDGKVDRYGQFVVGGINESADKSCASSVIKVDRSLNVTTILEGISCSNSICFSPDGSTMYLSDTPEGYIDAYPYHQECQRLIKPRRIYQGEGKYALPDGSTVDGEGYIWNAVWNGYSVVRIHPETGVIDKVIEVPVKNPTCVAIGGSDMKTLYVSSSRADMTENELIEQPFAGGLFALNIDVEGLT